MFSIKRLSTLRLRQLNQLKFPPRTDWSQAPKRFNSIATNATKPGGHSLPRWSTTGALMLSALTGVCVYSFTAWNNGPQRIATSSTELPETMPAYGSLKDMHDAVAKIQEILGEDSISTDDEVLLYHGYSAWSTTNVERLPIAVVYPKSTTEVSQIVKICHQYRVPMIPFSGGSSLEGNFAAPFGGMSIDFTHMNKIIDFHPEDMDIVVQPAVSWMELNEDIKASGLFFPVDPGPSAKIGGMVGTNCRHRTKSINHSKFLSTLKQILTGTLSYYSGTNAVRYGTMKDWVINMTVVLADGTVIKTRRRPRKSSAGYNLNHLFVGSEGTLGIVTEVTLKLAVVPQETSVAVVTFPSIRAAAAAASDVMRSGVPVAAMEIMDEVQMMVVNKAGATGKTWKEVPTLFFKFSGTKTGVLDNIGTVKKIAKAYQGGEFEFARTPEEQKTLWSARKESLWSMLSLRETGQEVWSTDVAVPLSRLADIIEISKKEMDDLGMFASILGHIGDGNFHESIMYDKNNPEEVRRIKKCVHDMVDRALEMEGTCTGEHGVGLGKKEYLVKELGLETLSVMKRIKLALDPLWLMNPGKIMDLSAHDGL